VKTGAGIMMCTARGKLSEGVNFRDNLARAVFIIGIPYLLINDIRVTIKKNFYHENHLKNKELQQQAQNELSTFPGSGEIKSFKPPNTGQAWYTMQAMREVNQIMGRCIRHINDFGSIFLVDERYDCDKHRKKLSYWI
jgi:Rad3-related DNA helicase